jgi:hypothetical protein
MDHKTDKNSAGSAEKRRIRRKNLNEEEIEINS